MKVPKIKGIVVKLYRLSFVILTVFLLSGCATGLANIKPGHTFDVNSEKSVVFGKVAFRLQLGGECNVVFKNKETKKTYHITAKDGPLYLFKKNEEWNGFVEKTFFIELPPGDYDMSKIIVRGFDLLSGVFNPKITFSVEPNSIVYIGTLTYEFEQEHDYIIVVEGTRYMRVYDDSENAIKELHDRYPDLKDTEVKISLMKLPQS